MKPTPTIAMSREVARALALALVLALPLGAGAAEVAKAVWMDSMSTALPTMFCGQSMYFRQCFNVTAPECEATAASATRVCLAKSQAQIPDVLVQPKDGTQWGTVVGQCAGEAYEITLVKKRISNARCNDPANWR